MLQLNRAIDRGYGSVICSSVGLEEDRADAGIVRSVTENTFYSMQRCKLKYHFIPRTSDSIDTTLIAGKLSDFTPVSVELISGSDWEAAWDHLVSSYHYLGYQSLLGHRLKYFAFIYEMRVTH